MYDWSDQPHSQSSNVIFYLWESELLAEANLGNKLVCPAASVGKCRQTEQRCSFSYEFKRHLAKKKKSSWLIVICFPYT